MEEVKFIPPLIPPFLHSPIPPFLHSSFPPFLHSSIPPFSYTLAAMNDAAKRFGSIFPFMEAGAQPRQIGRLVANYDFIKSLVTYGTFDEYVFSNTSVSNLSTFAETVKTWGLSDERVARVQYVGYAGLP